MPKLRLCQQQQQHQSDDQGSSNPKLDPKLDPKHDPTLLGVGHQKIIFLYRRCVSPPPSRILHLSRDLRDEIFSLAKIEPGQVMKQKKDEIIMLPSQTNPVVHFLLKFWLQQLLCGECMVHSAWGL